MHHIAYTYAGLGELLSTYRRLKAGGIEPARCINHGPTTSMYYRDPDGLRVELQVDDFATMDEAHAYLTGPEFAENPIGVIFDPEQLIRDYEAGRAVRGPGAAPAAAARARRPWTCARRLPAPETPAGDAPQECVITTRPRTLPPALRSARNSVARSAVRLSMGIGATLPALPSSSSSRRSWSVPT